VILAGGLGRRMGGIDKGLVSFHGRPLVAHVIERIAPQVDALMISANRSLESYQSFGYSVISDALPDFPGPLAGVLTALKSCSSELLLTVPCDTPLLPTDLVPRLLAALEAQGADIAIPHDGEQLQAAIMLMRASVKEDLQAYLLAGERRVQTWLDGHRTISVDYSDQRDAFVNLNTLPELHSLEQSRGH
jgi:molybdopterin-guanine dinucleotide biosynthesis protein A